MNIVKQVIKAIQLPTEELIQCGNYAIGMIRDDAAVGIMQDGSKNHKYSRQYAKYKANSMRPLSDKAGKKKKPGSMYAKSTNTETAFVNMTLTKKMFDGMKVTNKTGLTANGMFIQLAFDAKDAMKIIGNARHGYIVAGLRQENRDKLSKIIHGKIFNKGKYQSEK